MLTSKSTPLWTGLRRFSESGPLRMAMPGHKGKPIPGLPGAYARLDWTELPPTGDLYGGGDWIEAAEAAWAALWGADCCLFLTGGSTQGVHAMLRLADTDVILADRISHRSVHTGLALLGQEPVWLPRPWLDPVGTAGPVEPETVDRMLTARPDCGAVLVTSPTYYGVCSDLDALAEVCHRHGKKLLVDGAHGAHLFLLSGENPYRKADVVTVSAHKTLPAPGQSALLFGSGVTLDDLRQASLLFATSSPSYPMMAALDALRPWLAETGAAEYRRTADAVARLRARFPALGDRDTALDPTRFTLCVPDGNSIAAALQGRNIWPELSDREHVVFILTCADSGAEILRLEHALEELGLDGAARPPCFLSPPPEPEQVFSPRAALLGRRERVPLGQAAGRVAAEQLAPYPPGVPVVAPGEVIGEKVLAYLARVGYNKRDTYVLTENVR